ncbi:pentapeptide repeat-containing protein [Dactylosporangium sp. NBC_01737]|uniref:pentapeptide repeat-containing protein n=1 Tax=Dactylosporangium sp. NBC_01737 TaxID=2975959 RepID=UPI002E13AA5C|nr:pentapeptide repeat-containing protein [Dactylosporangium sp. NBC_01737]
MLRRRTFPRGARRRVAAACLAVAVLLGVLLLVRGRTGETHGRRCADPGAVSMANRVVVDSDLSQRRLRCADLERSTVEGFVREANLSGSNLHAARLRSVSMENVDLSGADLTDAAARDATLTGVELGRADLRRTVWQGSTFTDVGLRGAVLRQADLRRTEIRRSDLGGADARDADLTGASLIDTDLRGTRLDGADLDGTTWVNVVCPDGTKSGGDRESCTGHF